MNINTLRQLRHDLYECFSRAKDALFLYDVSISGTPVDHAGSL
jgi:hypothetical protein